MSNDLPTMTICQPAGRIFARSIALCMALLLALAGCGGGKDEAPPTPGAQTPALSGLVTDGSSAPRTQQPDVTVKGASGLARTTTRFIATSSYSVDLSQLDGPYLLSAPLTEGVPVLAPATASGTANLTPLTTLLVAQLVGQEPAQYFNNTLGNSGGVPAFTDADVVAAQAAVTRYLARVTGYDLRTGTDSWVTTAFTDAPGDPMFDEIVALNAALAGKGSNFTQLSGNIATQVQRCAAEQVRVQVPMSAGVPAASGSTFCPLARTARYAEQNQVIDFSFTDIEGSTLAVRARNGVVERVVYTATEGRFVCDGVRACAGAKLGSPGADGTRALTLTDLVLQGPAGSDTAMLTGTVRAADPGVLLPDLPCLNDTFYLVMADRSVQGSCMNSFGSSFRGLQEEQHTWGSADDALPYRVELVNAGTSVVRIDVWQTNPETGLDETLYRCVGSACAGATVGEPVDGLDADGYPTTTRRVTLIKTPMVAVAADGSLGADPAVTVSASLSSAVPFARPVTDCSGSLERTTVQLSDESAPAPVCPPAVDNVGAKSAYALGDGSVIYSVSSLATVDNGDGTRSETLNENLRVRVAGSTVLLVLFGRASDVKTLSCEGAACIGVTASAPDALGQITLTFANTPLVEDPARQVPGTTTATVNGAFLSAPVP